MRHLDMREKLLPLNWCACPIQSFLHETSPGWLLFHVYWFP